MADRPLSRRRFLAASTAAVGAAMVGLAACGPNHPPSGSAVPAGATSADGIPFLQRPEREGVIRWSGAENLVIENTKFTNRTYRGNGNNDHVCIMLTDCKNIIIRNIDFDTVAQPFVFGRGCDNITVEYCRARMITGPSERIGLHTGNFMQTVDSPSNINVVSNLIVGGDTEDIISYFTAVGGRCAGNRIDGSGWVSDSSTGIILGDGGGSGIVVEDNTLLNPGQVGIAIAGGEDHVVRNNTIYQETQSERTIWVADDGSTVEPLTAGAIEIPVRSNVGVYSSNFYPEYPFGGSVVHNNRVRFWSDDATLWNGFWDGETPAAVSEFDNEWNDDTIDAADLVVDLTQWDL